MANITEKIKMASVKDLTPYPNNPRKNEAAIEPVANSIREFGFKQPIVIDKDNTIIAGHTRLLAAKELGLTEVPVIVADDLTPEQVKAYRLADNKTAELAAWDFELLDLELEELGDIGDFDMGDFGFDLGSSLDTDGKSSKGGGEEIDVDDFSDDKFEHVCPQCGFHFSDKK